MKWWTHSHVGARKMPGNSIPERCKARAVDPSPHFEVVWQPSPAEAPIVLRTAPDAIEATLALREELARLRTQEAPGELLVRNGDRVRPPLVRQPLLAPGPGAQEH
jgi:hypothetical protein